MTATSADDGCGGWVVRIVVLGAEGVTQGVDGLALQAESDVGVDAGGDADVGVAQQPLDHNEIDALFQEQGGSRVAEVVEADAAEPGPVEEAAEAAGEVGLVERPSGRRGEDEPAVAPVRSCCLSLPVLASSASSPRSWPWSSSCSSRSRPSP